MHDDASRTANTAWRSDQGSVAILIAVSLTMLLGFVALGSDVVFAMYKQRQMEAAAASAALAGAVALATGHPANYKTEVNAVATASGFTTAVSGVAITINNPPKSGPNTANNNAVEVIIAQPQTLPLFEMFVSGPLNISGRAVAIAGSSGSACVLALDTSYTTASAPAVVDGNGASITLNGCGMASNAGGPGALSVTGGAVLNASAVSLVGTDTVNNGGTITATNGVKTGQTAVTDPYAGITVPAFTAGHCDYGSLPTNGYSVSNGWQNPTLSPGVYCGGLSTGGGGTVTLNPGIYIIDGGSFSPGGGTTVTGTGVTIVLTGSGTNYATAQIANGVTITLSAPTTGSTAGLVFFADPAAPVNTYTSSVQGGSVMNLTGALYFPTQTLDYGNGSNTTTTCTQLDAWHIVFEGGATLKSNCSGTGTLPIGGSSSKLVE
jgi:hypothetical protein